MNFFENTKETINQCDKAKPRFHAFLKVDFNLIFIIIQMLHVLLLSKQFKRSGSDSEKFSFKVCQSKPECGRQTLTELLIRPVQRLPSVMLLLKELLKRTERNLPDHTQLINSIETLEEVMT